MSYTPPKTVQYAFRDCVNCEGIEDCRHIEDVENYTGIPILPEECHKRDEIKKEYEQRIQNRNHQGIPSGANKR